ncbi:hypothetical protein A0H81_02161 [Grifola frondosa]|uniref:C2H2-type domain-containing protein n=1 Tax=Grifola frondosa TaxID=5627 RepID=A0A1C7MPS3_GRIFR|nr:hypothetical protein A0H81_02161 [Grifola frondosa]
MFHPVSNSIESSSVMSMHLSSPAVLESAFDDALSSYPPQYDDALGEATFSKWLDPNSFLVESNDFFQPSIPDLLMGTSSTSDVPTGHLFIPYVAAAPLASLSLGVGSVPVSSPSTGILSSSGPADFFRTSGHIVEVANTGNDPSLDGRRYIGGAGYLFTSPSLACPSLSLSPLSSTNLTFSIPPTPLSVHPDVVCGTIDPSLLSPPEFCDKLKVNCDALSDSSYESDEDEDAEGEAVEVEVKEVVSDDDEDKASQELAPAVEEPAATPKQQTRRKDATRGTRKSSTAGATRETRKAAATRAQKATTRKAAVVTRKNTAAARKASTPPRAQVQRAAAAPTTSRTTASSSSATLHPVPGRQIPRSTRDVLAFAGPSCVASSSSSAPTPSSSRKDGQKRKRSSRDDDDDDDVPDRDAGDWRRYSGDDGSGSEHEDDGEMDVDNDSDYEQADDEDDEDYGRAHKRQKTAPASHAQKKAPKAKKKGKARATEEQSEPGEQKTDWKPFCLSAGAHYSCKLCRKTFGRKGDVKRHLEKSCKHPDAPLQTDVTSALAKRSMAFLSAMTKRTSSLRTKNKYECVPCLLLLYHANAITFRPTTPHPTASGFANAIPASRSVLCGAFSIPRSTSTARLPPLTIWHLTETISQEQSIFR